MVNSVDERGAGMGENKRILIRVSARSVIK